MTASRAAAVILAFAAAACTPPHRSADPARARWAVVLSTHGDGVLQFRPGRDAAEAPLTGLIREMESRFGGPVDEWIVSPDGRRVAFTAAVPDESSARPALDSDPPGASSDRRRPGQPLARAHRDSFTATTNGPPWDVVPIPDPAPRISGIPDTVRQLLVWSADSRRFAYRELVWDAARATWVDDNSLAVLDTGTGRVERYSVDAQWIGAPFGFAFSPDGLSIAFTKRTGGVAAIDLATRAVTDVALPGGPDLELLAWLPDGRFACRTKSGGRRGRAVLARPGDASLVELPTDPEQDLPLSIRPDAGAVVCVRTRFSGFAAIPSLRIRYTDGTCEDLDDVEGLRGKDARAVVWVPAPGLAPATPR